MAHISSQHCAAVWGLWRPCGGACRGAVGVGAHVWDEDVSKNVLDLGDHQENTPVKSRPRGWSPARSGFRLLSCYRAREFIRPRPRTRNRRLSRAGSNDCAQAHTEAHANSNTIAQFGYPTARPYSIRHGIADLASWRPRRIAARHHSSASQLTYRMSRSHPPHASARSCRSALPSAQHPRPSTAGSAAGSSE